MYLDAYQERRLRELREWASVTAIAHHDPKGIEKALKPPKPEGEKRVPWWKRKPKDS